MKGLNIRVRSKNREEDDGSTVGISWIGTAVPDLSEIPSDEDYDKNLAQWGRINNLVHALVAELEFAEFGWEAVVETS